MRKITLALAFSIFALIVLIGCTVKAPEKVDEVPDVGQGALDETPVAEPELNETEVNVSQNDETTATEEIPKEEIIETNISTGSELNASVNSSKPVVQKGKCSDTDATEEFPDGMNIGVKGKITVNGVAIRNGEDYCTTLVQVSEWYCNFDSPRVIVKKCPGTCDKTLGACV